MRERDLITAVVLTSPVPSNPSTEIIDKTLNSIRHWFPEIDIRIMYDGIRAEQEEMKKNYREFYYRLVLEARGNVYHHPFINHVHQIGMMREFMKMCRTPFLIFCEHDTPLVTDETIPWESMLASMMEGHYDFIRFLPEAHIHPEHEHLMRGREQYNGVPITETVQFSARPHIATKDFYRRVLERFSPQANSFIEDRMHSICQDDPWEIWKMVIYTPPGNAKRSLHLDGRAGAEKFEGSQIF